MRVAIPSGSMRSNHCSLISGSNLNGRPILVVALADCSQDILHFQTREQEFDGAEGFLGTCGCSVGLTYLRTVTACFKATELESRRTARGRVRPKAWGCYLLAHLKGLLCGGDLGQRSVMCRPQAVSSRFVSRRSSRPSQ